MQHMLTGFFYTKSTITNRCLDKSWEEKFPPNPNTGSLKMKKISLVPKYTTQMYVVSSGSFKTLKNKLHFIWDRTVGY